MTLRRMKTLYCIAVMAIGILLTALGGLLGWIAAILLLSGALPGWAIATRAASDQGASEALSVVKHHLRRRNP